MADLPEPPSSDDPANFEDEADAFLGALPQFEIDMEAASAAAVAAAASATSSAASASTSAGNAASSAAAAQASAASLITTSTDSNAVPTTSGVDKTFPNVQSGDAWVAGMPVKAARTSAPAASYFTGVVKSYSGTTLVITSDGGHGLTTGTFSDWTITLNVAGLPAATKEDVWAKSTNKIVPPDVLLDAVARQTITYGVSMTWPVATKGFSVEIVVAGSEPIPPPDTLYDGVIYTVYLKQDATGGRTVVLDSIWDLGSQTIGESNTAANKVNLLSGPYHSGLGKILANLRPAG